MIGIEMEDAYRMVGAVSCERDLWKENARKLEESVADLQQQISGLEARLKSRTDAYDLLLDANKRQKKRIDQLERGLGLTAPPTIMSVHRDDEGAVLIHTAESFAREVAKHLYTMPIYTFTSTPADAAKVAIDIPMHSAKYHKMPAAADLGGRVDHDFHDREPPPTPEDINAAGINRVGVELLKMEAGAIKGHAGMANTEVRGDLWPPVREWEDARKT